MQFPRTVFEIKTGKADVVNSQKDFDAKGNGWTASQSLVKIEKIEQPKKVRKQKELKK